jgi:hypothetical protein
MFGGFYQHEKKKAGQMQPETIQLQGLDVPRTVTHFPLVEAAQLGATIRKTSESVEKWHGKRGLPYGVMAGALGLSEETPYIGNMVDMAKLFWPNDREKYLGELAKSSLVPQLLSQTAQATDRDWGGNNQEINRNFKGPIQAVKSGIPGLRQTLPPKP